MGNLLRAFAVLSVATASTTAFAEPSVEVTMKSHDTILDVTIDGAQLPAGNELAVRTFGMGDRRQVSATSVKSYVQGTEPIAIMFVVSGQEVWLGNNSFETDPNAQVPDALGPLEKAIDALDLVHRVPPGSQAGIVAYANGASVRMALSPVEQFHGSSFGVQHDYYNKIGNDLTTGIATALGQLERATTPRKMLVVLGDGTDTNSDAAAPELAQLKKRAAVDGIATFAIVYKQRFSADTTEITRMIPGTATVASTDRFADQLDWIVQRATRRFYATFDIRSLPVFDGRDHDLVVTLGDIDLDPVTLWFPRRAEGPAWWRSPWFQLAAGLLGVGTLAWLARRAAR